MALLKLLNYLLETEFSIIRELFFKDILKLGLIIWEMKPKSSFFTYSFSRIFTKEEEIIQFLPDKDWNIHIKSGKSLETQYGINMKLNESIFTDKEIIVTDFLKNYLDIILEKKLLKHNNLPFLAKEFIFSIITRYSDQLGLKQKDEYMLNEIKYGFYSYLPTWVNVSIKFQNKQIFENILSRNGFIDLEHIKGAPFQKEIHNRVKNFLNNNDEKIKARVPFGSTRIPLGLFHEFFNELDSKGIKSIKRVYNQKDFERLKKYPNITFNLITKEELIENLKILFNNFYENYSSVLEQNFPYLLRILQPFKGNSDILIQYGFKETYEGIRDSPIIAFLFGKKPSSIDSIPKKDEKKLEIQYTPKLNLQVENYEIRRSTVADFLFDDLPLLNYIYETLSEEIEYYFNPKESYKCLHCKKTNYVDVPFKKGISNLSLTNGEKLVKCFHCKKNNFLLFSERSKCHKL